MTEEQRVAQSDNESPPAPSVRPAAPEAAPRRGGCFARFLAAILVIVITTFLALLAGASGLLWLGYMPDTPRQLGAAQAQLATMQAQSDALRTQVAEQTQRSAADHEALGELGSQLANIQSLRDTLRQEREQSVSQNATLVAEARSSRDAVALFATVESGRAALLAELDRRSARVERFVQRLSDISSDTALDLGATQPPVAPTLPPAPTIISELSPTPTPTPAATSTSVPTEPPTESRQTEGPSASPRRASPTASAEPSPTPTLGH
ncbi:MAG TPA: hypothetical protein VKE41_02070 [Roseiflexaceae bacterium]|nr:hypothetical protein [Roseiflexaceae bacterium]